jgi:hypothetical protein
MEEGIGGPSGTSGWGADSHAGSGPAPAFTMSSKDEDRAADGSFHSPAYKAAFLQSLTEVKRDTWEVGPGLHALPPQHSRTRRRLPGARTACRSAA